MIRGQKKARLEVINHECAAEIARAWLYVDKQSASNVFGMYRLSEGRQPWTLKTSVQPEREFTDAESGIWALAGPQTPGGLILGGTEDGMVLAWDVRSPLLAWQVSSSSD